MYEKNDTFVKNIFVPMYRTNASSINFKTTRITNVFTDKNSEIRMFMFPINADTKNRKNMGLVVRVNFEFFLFYMNTFRFLALHYYFFYLSNKKPRYRLWIQKQNNP